MCVHFSARMFPHMLSVCVWEMREYFVVMFADRKCSVLGHVHSSFLSKPSVLMPWNVFVEFFFLYFPCSFQALYVWAVCFYFICLITSFRSSQSSRFACDRGQIVHTAPSLWPVWFSLVADFSPDSQRMAANLVCLWSSNKLVANENAWKNSVNLSAERIIKEELQLQCLPAKPVWAIQIESLNMRSVRYADVCPYLPMLQISDQNCFSDILMKPTVWNSPKCLIFRCDAYTLCGAKLQSIVFSGHLASRNCLPLRLLWFVITGCSKQLFEGLGGDAELQWRDISFALRCVSWNVFCLISQISDLQSYFKVTEVKSSHKKPFWLFKTTCYDLGLSST